MACLSHPPQSKVELEGLVCPVTAKLCDSGVGGNKGRLREDGSTPGATWILGTRDHLSFGLGRPLGPLTQNMPSIFPPLVPAHTHVCVTG